jgi:hypothetical protein
MCGSGFPAAKIEAESLFHKKKLHFIKIGFPALN